MNFLRIKDTYINLNKVNQISILPAISADKTDKQIEIETNTSVHRFTVKKEQAEKLEKLIDARSEI